MINNKELNLINALIVWLNINQPYGFFIFYYRIKWCTTSSKNQYASHLLDLIKSEFSKYLSIPITIRTARIFLFSEVVSHLVLKMMIGFVYDSEIFSNVFDLI